MSVAKLIAVQLVPVKPTTWVYRPAAGLNVSSIPTASQHKPVSTRGVKILAQESVAKTPIAELSTTIQSAVALAIKLAILSFSAAPYLVIKCNFDSFPEFQIVKKIISFQQLWHRQFNLKSPILAYRHLVDPTAPAKSLTIELLAAVWPT